jgi:hypothetical protein
MNFIQAVKGDKVAFRPVFGNMDDIIYHYKFAKAKVEKVDGGELWLRYWRGKDKHIIKLEFNSKTLTYDGWNFVIQEEAKHRVINYKKINCCDRWR